MFHQTLITETPTHFLFLKEVVNIVTVYTLLRGEGNGTDHIYSNALYITWRGRKRYGPFTSLVRTPKEKNRKYRVLHFFVPSVSLSFAMLYSLHIGDKAKEKKYKRKT